MLWSWPRPRGHAVASWAAVSSSAIHAGSSLAVWGLASLHGGGPSILLASWQRSTCLLLFDLAVRCVPDLLPEIFSVWLMKLLDIWTGWNPVLRTHIRQHGFMTVRREAPLVVETMGHVGISISMVYTAVEKVKVAEIGGPVLAETSEVLKILLHEGR